MKHGYLIIVPAVLALFFYSCDSDPIFFYNPETDPSWGNFWAIDVSLDSAYRVDAEMLASGDLCEIWVDKKSGVGAATAKAMIEAYEGVEGEAGIYQKMMTTYNMGPDDYEGKPVANTMDAADLLGYEDGKLCILLLDIRDGYRSDIGSYVAGYFWSEDILPTRNNPYSNRRDMIYVDTYPAIPGSPESNSTIAHEMQHLMNFVTSQIKRKVGSAAAQTMDIWIDEGLANAAEWVYSGEHSEQRLWWFSEDPYSTISQRNNFYVWDNYEGLVLDDYATVYLFFQWLRLRFPDVPNIYNKIITSQYSDYKAITSNTNNYVDDDADGWATLMKEWLIANYVKDSEGPYGYGNAPKDYKLNETWYYEDDNTNVNVRAKTIPKKIQDDYKNNLSGYKLYPGEAVYSLIGTGNGNTTPPQSGNIRYATMKRGDPNAVFADGSTLLSFNVNTANDGQNMITEPVVDYENSTITGNADENDWSKDSTDTSRSMSGGQTFPGPFAVSAWDMIRMNKNKKNNSGNKPARVPRRLADE